MRGRAWVSVWHGSEEMGGLVGAYGLVDREPGDGKHGALDGEDGVLAAGSHVPEQEADDALHARCWWREDVLLLSRQMNACISMVLEMK